MHLSDLIIIAVFTAFSLSMIVSARSVAWLYRRGLLARIGRGRPEPPSSLPREGGGTFRAIRAEDVPVVERWSPAGQVRNEAMRVNAAVRRAYRTAWLVYAVAIGGLMLVYFTSKWPWDGRLAAIYAFLVPQLVVVMATMRVRLRSRFVVFTVYSAVGIALLLLTRGPTRTAVILDQIPVPFAITPLAALSFMFARRVQPFLVLIIPIIIEFGGLGLLLTVLEPNLTSGIRQELFIHPQDVLFGLLSIVLGVVVASALWKGHRRTRVTGLAVALIGSAILVYDFIHRGFPIVLILLEALAFGALQGFLIWLIFRLFAWLLQRRWLTTELLQTHLLWVWLTCFYELWIVYTAMYSNGVVVACGLVVAVVLYLAVLHFLLSRIRSQRSQTAPRRLLLLRVFGGADKREDLLDHLDDTWRRIGAVDLIGAPDVASRTLNASMLEAFLLRRSDEQFLRSEDDVDRRIANPRSAIEADARYPVDPAFCYPDLWQIAVAGLARGADVVLMDLRGFTASRTGSAWEFAYLLQHFEFRRIVLIGDQHTKFEALRHVVPVSREFTVLSFDRKSDKNRLALFDRLLSAAL